MSGKQAKKTYLGLGSNLGNKKRNIEHAKFLLQQNKNFKILWKNLKRKFNIKKNKIKKISNNLKNLNKVNRA